MNVSFTSKQEKYIASLIESGDYQNASEAVREAVRLHQLYRDKIIGELKAEIEIGWNDRDSSKSISDIVASKTKKRS